MSMNFADALNTNVEDIKKPPLLPVGTYRFKIMKIPTSTTTGDGKWDILNFVCRVQEAMDDVDVDSFEGELTKQIASRRFMFNKEDQAEFARTLDNVKTFLTKHVKVEGKNLKELLNNSLNGEFLGVISWRQDKNDEENWFADLNKTMPVEA